MIIITGGAGFVGSNLIHELNRAGEKDILGNVYKGKVNLGPASFQLKRCTAVGGYAIQPEWMDGHGSGIYSFTYLK